ncbi:hypothetical protein GCM10027592_26140 [Spirosoma flavus]
MVNKIYQNDVKDIILRYNNHQLPELDDKTLIRAANKLEYVYKHYFDGLSTKEMSATEFYYAQQDQKQLRLISDSIWQLLCDRYKHID